MQNFLSFFLVFSGRLEPFVVQSCVLCVRLLSRDDGIDLRNDPDLVGEADSGLGDGWDGGGVSRRLKLLVVGLVPLSTC